MRAAWLACLLLAGCATTQAVQQENPEPRKEIAWSKGDWRICDEGQCQKPTPKTVLILVQKPADPDQIKEAALPEIRQAVIYFAFGKAQPVGAWRQALQKVASEIKPGDKIVVKAYTDSIGSDQYNERLAQERAKFVVAWLRAHGVKNPTEVDARGKCCYVASNSTEKGRAANRRAEVFVFGSRKEVK